MPVISAVVAGMRWGRSSAASVSVASLAAPKFAISQRASLPPSAPRCVGAQEYLGRLETRPPRSLATTATDHKRSRPLGPFWRADVEHRGIRVRTATVGS